MQQQEELIEDEKEQEQKEEDARRARREEEARLAAKLLPESEVCLTVITMDMLLSIHAVPTGETRRTGQGCSYDDRAGQGIGRGTVHSLREI